MTQELRKLAEAATVGVWKASGFSVNSKEHGWATIANTELDYDGMAENAAFIAAANPAVILALLDRLEKAEKDAARLRDKCDHSMSEVNRLTVKCSNLHEALRESREALQFANDTPNGPICDTIWMMHRPETLFDFMDTAMEASK